MARNRVQFQKGLSAPEFERLYGTEEQCRAVIVASRWPDGFVCPACGGTRHSVVKTRGLYQCSTCRTQTSAFRRDDLRRDQAEAARLGPNPLSPDPDQAGDLQNRPRPASRRGDADHRLEDQAQARSGHVRTRRRQAAARAHRDRRRLYRRRTHGLAGRGRGAAGKTPFVAALETTP